MPLASGLVLVPLPSSVTGPGLCDNLYLTALPSGEHLPELQSILDYRSACGARGMEGGSRLSSFGFTLSPQAAGDSSGCHLQSAELSPPAPGLLLRENEQQQH